MRKNKPLIFNSIIVLSMILAPLTTIFPNVTMAVQATHEESSIVTEKEAAIPMGRVDIFDENYALPHWNHNLMNIGAARQEGLTGAGVSIAVLDTGFYADHPDMHFAGGQSLFADDEWTNDHTGHGTHVAGIIGANANSAYPGVAPDASVYGIKVYHKDQIGEYGEPLTDIENIAEGIRTAANMGVNIILISSGVTADTAELHEAVKHAQSMGALIIAAAGNGTAFVQYPAAYPEVVAVSSVDANTSPAGDIIFGPENEIAAPGVGITSLSTPDSPYGYPYVVMSGSSQAAPHVAGLAALLMQKHGTNAATIRELLREGAYDLGESNLFGYGLAGFLSEGVMETPEEETPTTSEEEQEQDTEENHEQTTGRLARVLGEANPDTATYEDSKKEQKQYSNIVVVPTLEEDIATFETDAIQFVKDNGALFIDVGALSNVSATLRIRKEQARLLRERNISLLLLHDDFEWTIPASNLRMSDWRIQYENVERNFKNEQSLAYRFSIKENQEEITDFKQPMTIRYYFDDSMKDFQLYHLVEDQWETYSGETETGSIAFQTDRLPKTFGFLDATKLSELSEKAPEEKTKSSRRNQAKKVYQIIKAAAGVLTAALLLFFFINHFRRKKDLSKN